MLYVLMGTAVWLVSRERYHARRNAALRRLLPCSSLLNAAWAPLFFGAWNLGAGLFDSVALWLAVALDAARILAGARARGRLLVPYFAWVSYAMALNFSLWRLNQ